MNIFILNAGSSSVKFQMIEMPSEASHIKGIVDGIGQDKGFFKIQCNGDTKKIEQKIHSHEEAVGMIFDQLSKTTDKTIDLIGHRVVHGGEKYSAATWVDDSVIKDIEDLCDLAPLHNPAHLAGILACKKVLPKIQNITVFDTAFHQTIPPKAYLYALPYELYEKFRIRKYGFHGISHKYVAKEAARILGKDIRVLKTLSCHLGAGASICAILGGESVEISMGFTPLDGLMMGTRTGSFDPAIIIYLLKKGDTVDQLDKMMQKESGLKGISRHSRDVRELREDVLAGNKQSQLAFDMFDYRIQKYIGSYTAILDGLDLLIFTAGIGEKAFYLRETICSNLNYLGIKIDSAKNAGDETIISTPDSKVNVLVIPTNEELQIARESYELAQKSGLAFSKAAV